MACLTPLGIEKLKKMISTNGSKLSQLSKMETTKRKETIESFMGKDNVDYVNYEIEKRLISKTTKPLRNWVEKTVTSPKLKSDILKRVGKLEGAIRDEGSLRLLAGNKARDTLIEDLIAHKLGVAVTQEETGVIMDLAFKADQAREEITKVANSKTKYGKAYNLMSKGVSQEEALEDSGISQKEYDEITEKRIEAGVELYKYTDYMDKLKQEADALKKSDFSKNWMEATKKLGNEIKESVRSVLASGELGFIFRQGLKAMYKDPKIWARNSLDAVNNAIKGAKNINFKANVMAEIMTRPNYLSGHYAEAKLAINTIEDYYQNSWINRVMETDKPNFIQNLGQRYQKMSEDTYLAYLFKMRADLFDAHFDKLQEAGADYKGIGQFINNLTGRGEGKVAKRGSDILFSARYTQSQINSFTKMFTENNSKLRAEYLKNTGSLLAGIATVIGIMALFGVEPEDDPRSTKFGRVVFPNGYVMDISGGLTTYIVLMSRLLSGKIKTGSGKVKKLGSFGTPDAKGLISNFLFSKGAPQVSVATTLMNRELFGGKKLTAQSFAASLAPIFGQEAVEKLTDEEAEIFARIMLTISAFFGLSSYNPQTFKKTRSR